MISQLFVSKLVTSSLVSHLDVISCLSLCMQVPIYEDLGNSSFSVLLPEIQFTLNFLRVCTLVSVTHSTMYIVDIRIVLDTSLYS